MGAKTALWVLWQLNYFRDVPIIGNIEKEIAAKILNLFLPLDESVPFSDIWYNILPMDNAIKDTLMPSCFAEFWVDMDKAAGEYQVLYTPSLKFNWDKFVLDAVSTLRDLHMSDSSTIGNYFTEFYCAKVCQPPFDIAIIRYLILPICF